MWPCGLVKLAPRVQFSRSMTMISENRGDVSTKIRSEKREMRTVVLVDDDEELAGRVPQRAH